jgi:hypothetical protein
MIPFVRCACIVLALPLAAGCGSNLKLVPVTGKVTLNGAPLPYKSLMFIPESTEIGIAGGGNTQQDGSYSVIASMPGATTDQAGLPPGKYRVIVFEPQIPIAADMPVQSSDESDVVVAVTPDTRRRKIEIPSAYTKQETTPFVLEVPAEGGVLDLKLVSKSR